jgi:hypothetical protein
MTFFAAVTPAKAGLENLYKAAKKYADFIGVSVITFRCIVNFNLPPKINKDSELNLKINSIKLIRFLSSVGRATDS